jgi:large subunit ribosomal protein L33
LILCNHLGNLDKAKIKGFWDLIYCVIYVKFNGELADLAQLAEQRFCKPEVVGSNPTVGSILIPSKLRKRKAMSQDNMIKLECTECKNINYHSRKNKKNTPNRLEVSKYCKHCKKHTAHKETK